MTKRKKEEIERLEWIADQEDHGKYVGIGVKVYYKDGTAARYAVQKHNDWWKSIEEAKAAATPALYAWVREAHE